MPERTYGSHPPRRVYTVDEFVETPVINIFQDNTYWRLIIDRSTWTGPEELVDPILQIQAHFSNDNGVTWKEGGVMECSYGEATDDFGEKALASNWTGSLPFVGSKTRKLKFTATVKGTVDFEGTLEIKSDRMFG